MGDRGGAAPRRAGLPRPQDQRKLAHGPGGAARPAARRRRGSPGARDASPGCGPQGGRGRADGARRGARRPAAGRGAAAVLRGAHPVRARAARVGAPVGADRRPAPEAVGVPGRGSRTVEETGVGRVEHWAEEPEYGAANPATAEPVTAEWPVDPLGARAAAVHAGARAGARRAARARRGAAPEHEADARAPGWSCRDPSDPTSGTRPATRTTRRPIRRAGPPTSTCCSPSAPPPASAPSSRCPRSCR